MWYPKYYYYLYTGIAAEARNCSYKASTHDRLLMLIVAVVVAQHTCVYSHQVVTMIRRIMEYGQAASCACICSERHCFATACKLACTASAAA
jgi:hypothetical protein